MIALSPRECMAQEIGTLKQVNELLNAGLDQKDVQLKNQSVVIGCQAKQVGQLQQQVEYLTQCRIELEYYNWWDRIKAAAIAILIVEAGHVLWSLRPVEDNQQQTRQVEEWR